MSGAFESLHDAISTFRDKRVLFVGGSAKSGTTWVQRLLDAHPDISCRGEGHLIDKLAPTLREAFGAYNLYIRKQDERVGAFGGFPMLSSSHQDYLLTAAIVLLLAEGARGRPVSVIGDKTPDNVVRFPRLKRLFPRARFVHVIRDGRDCAVSGWFHNQNLSRARGEAFGATLDGFADWFAGYWRDVIIAGEAFATQNADCTLAIRYEDLINAPEASARRLLVFLGVDASDTTVQQCLGEASFERLSGGRPAGDVDEGSFFRSGTIGDWRALLSEDAAARFHAVAGDQLALLGYT